MYACNKTLSREEVKMHSCIISIIIISHRCSSTFPTLMKPKLTPAGHKVPLPAHNKPILITKSDYYYYHYYYITLMSWRTMRNAQPPEPPPSTTTKSQPADGLNRIPAGRKTKTRTILIFTHLLRSPLWRMLEEDSLYQAFSGVAGVPPWLCP